MIADFVIKHGKPLHCPTCKKAKRATGAVSTDQRYVARMTLMRVSLSRLEEGLGHEAFRCEKCDTTIKVIPKE